jgi:hypothetical protein
MLEGPVLTIIASISIDKDKYGRLGLKVESDGDEQKLVMEHKRLTRHLNPSFGFTSCP